MVQEFIIIGNLSSNSWITRDKSRALEKKEEKQREREMQAKFATFD